MNGFQLSPDEWVFWEWGFVKLNATIVYTWIVMAVLVVLSVNVTRKRFFGDPNNSHTNHEVSAIQSLLEVLVGVIRTQIRDISRQDPTPYVPFVGTLFLFIAMANLLSIVPGYQTPTASLSTTAALATCVLVAVPLYGIGTLGFRAYCAQYLHPTVIMLPFNIIGEISRTVALAVRLYGNMMSGAVIVTVLLAFVPLLVPIAMRLLGLLTGMIQAYIFAILAMVYIASATRVRNRNDPGVKEERNGNVDATI